MIILELHFNIEDLWVQLFTIDKTFHIAKELLALLESIAVTHEDNADSVLVWTAVDEFALIAKKCKN